MLDERKYRTMRRVMLVVMLAMGLLLIGAGQAAAQEPVETERERTQREEEERDRERRGLPKVVRPLTLAEEKAMAPVDCNSIKAEREKSDCWKRKATIGVKDLQGADLRGVKLTFRNLRDANFSNANLVGVDFQNSDLDGAKLSGAKIDMSALSSTRIKPDEWKRRGGIITDEPPAPKPAPKVIDVPKPNPYAPRPRVSGPIIRVNLTGRVKFFNDLKGFGTITAMEGEGDCFVHHSEIKVRGAGGRKTLVQNELVKFVRVTGSQSGPTCQDVWKIKESAGISPIPLEIPVTMMAVVTKGRE